MSQYIVVDTGIAMAGATIAAIDASDIIFLITSRDVARLLSAKNMIKFLKNDRQVTNQKLKVLINEARNRRGNFRKRNRVAARTPGRRPIFPATRGPLPFPSTAARPSWWRSRTTRFLSC